MEEPCFSLAEHSLSTALPKIATSAILDRDAQAGQAFPFWQKVECRDGELFVRADPATFDAS